MVHLYSISLIIQISLSRKLYWVKNTKITLHLEKSQQVNNNEYHILPQILTIIKINDENEII